MAQWPDSSTFLDDHDGCEQEDFFQCGAVELAQKLLGQYLYCHESKIVVRILETEAYPEDDAPVYKSLFCVSLVKDLNPNFKIKGGIMVAWKPASHYYETKRMHLYITAGTEDSGDVVYLRSCQPIEGRALIQNRRQLNDASTKVSKEHVLIGPSKIFEGLGNEWESNPVLYEEGGVQLFYGTAHEKLLCGRRLLKNDLSRTTDDTADYRFALETNKPSYQYKMKKTLKRLQQ